MYVHMCVYICMYVRIMYVCKYTYVLCMHVHIYVCITYAFSMYI